MSLKSFNQTLTVAGSVVSIDETKPSFSVRARSGDVFEAVVGPETYYSLVSNLDGLDRNRVPEPQECAVLSRQLYDLSSAYLMTGAQRYLMAARAAANYLREAFRSLSHDGRYCFWAYGPRRNLLGERGKSLLFASQGLDAGSRSWSTRSRQHAYGNGPSQTA